MRPSIFDVALSYENGNNGVIKSNTNVVVHTNRLWYGKNGIKIDVGPYIDELY